MSTELDELKKTLESTGRVAEEMKTALKQRDEDIKKLGVESSETKAKLDKVNTALDSLGDVRATLEKRLNDIEAAVKRGAMGGGKTGNDADPAQVEVKAAMVRYLRSCNPDQLEAMKAKHGSRHGEVKALTVNSDPDGGYHVISDMSGQVATKVFETSDMRAIASVQAIATDALEGWDDIDEADGEWVGEETTPAANSDTPQMGKWRIPVHEMATRPKASNKILEDANIDIEAWLMRKVTEKFGRMENTAFVSGNGTTRPRGILTYDSGTSWKQIQQILMGTAPDEDDLIDIIQSLKDTYRANGTWIFNRLTTGYIRKLKDDEGRMLWRPGLEQGQPDRLLGYPIKEFSDMPDIADGAIPMGFGDFKRGYQIVDRLGFAVLRDPFTAKPYVEFYCRRRVGGDVVNFEAFKLGKSAAA